MWRAGNRVPLFTLQRSFASTSVRLQWNEGFVHRSDIQNFLKDTTLTEWVQNSVADQEQIECSPWPTRVTLLVREGGGFGGRAYSHHWLGIQRDLMQQQMQIPGSFDTTGCCAAPLREQKALPEMQLPQSSCSCGSMIHLEGMGAWLGIQPESIFYEILKHRFFFFLKQTRIQICWEIYRSPNYGERWNNTSSQVLMQHNFKANSCGLVSEVPFFSLYL